MHWLVSRQTTELGEEDEVSDDADISNDVQQLEDNVEAFHPADNISSLPDLSPHIEGSFLWAGFNGRCNKLADTCYSFWTAGSLAVRSPYGYSYLTSSLLTTRVICRYLTDFH